ncbi:protein of unknown function [Ralstonia solanacearum CMR15]|nr:protein of unknown function [Ralstonia solanacearum CMR15]
MKEPIHVAFDLRSGNCAVVLRGRLPAPYFEFHDSDSPSEQQARNVASEMQPASMVTSTLGRRERVAVIPLKHDLVVLPLFRYFEAHILQSAPYLRIHASKVTQECLQAISHGFGFTCGWISLNDAAQNVLTPAVFGDASDCISDGITNDP